MEIENFELLAADYTCLNTEYSKIIEITMSEVGSELSDNNSINFANKVAKRIIQVYEKLPKSGKPIDQEYTVLSGVVLFHRATGEFKVISLGTGTKCLGGSKLSPNGGILNDSHAEIFARRGLLIYLHDTLKKTLQGDTTVFKLVNDKFQLCNDYEFHFYSSQLPCGDACIMPKVDEDCEKIGLPVLSNNMLMENNKRKAEDYISHGDTKKQKMSLDIQRTGAKCLPHCEQDTKEPGEKYHLLGQVRTKPGRGERTLSVSCSDKISKWIHLGIQGSLLGMLLSEPIYLKSIIIGGGVPYSKESLERALLLRNPNFKIENMPELEQSSVVFPYLKSENRSKAGPTSIVWVDLKERCHEVGANGIKLGTSKKHAADAKKSLCISKYNIYRRFVQLLSHCNQVMVKNLIGVESYLTIPYNEMKRKNKEYYDKWAIVKQDFFKTWTTKPDIWNFCAGDIVCDNF